MKNADKDYTSYTGLSGIDGWLRNVPPFIGNEGFLLLGRAVHRKWLEGKSPESKLSDRQKMQLAGMVHALNKNKEAMSLHKGALKELEFKPDEEHPHFGIKVKLLMDILKNKEYGADLKTSGAPNKEKFIKSAVAFGYFGQVYIYKTISGVKEFYIIAVQKELPHNVYILDVKEYPKEYKKAQQKIDFLAYVFKNHRKDIDL